MIDLIHTSDTIDKLKSLFKQKGYSFFESGNYNLNIIGVRGEHKPDEFSDKLYIIFREYGSMRVLIAPMTTYPGLYWLRNPMTPEGCAIMKEGQYRKAYQIGNHRRVTALIQTGNKVKVYRDNTKDGTITLLEDSVIDGYFGINIHPVMDKNNKTVGQDSAGCQVLQDYEDFRKLIRLCYSAMDVYGNYFTYTLINEKDLCL